MRRRDHAFTLIELLVVIAILALLAALLFPVFARAKAQAKQTTCISNLKQIGSAIALYMGDHDDLFPHAVDASDRFASQIWSEFPEFQARIPHMPLLNEVLQPYLKSQEVFRCPADSGTEVLDTFFPQRFYSSPTMYGRFQSSYFFRTEIAFRYFSQTNFRLPTEVNVLFDGAGHWHGSRGALRPNSNPFEHYPGFRYNVLYGDFHARSRSFDQLQQAWAIEL